MLILTRHKEESVIINGNIKVTVLGIDRGVPDHMSQEGSQQLIVKQRKRQFWK
jgi:hypothetical protein